LDSGSFDLVTGEVIKVNDFSHKNNPKAPIKYTIKDNTGEIDLSLWKWEIPNNLGIGSKVKIEECEINIYNGKKSIQLTRNRSGPNGGVEIIYKEISKDEKLAPIIDMEEQEKKLDNVINEGNMDRIVRAIEQIQKNTGEISKTLKEIHELYINK